ncbi:hypothetical protein AAOGI_05780 [Agarivorans albus]
MIDQAIYNSVLDLACELVNSSGAGLTKNYWDTYQQLNAICETNKGSNKDHPFQWETLADYTKSAEQAIRIYLVAIEVAKKLNLVEFLASSQLALAERYLELTNISAAINWASIANENALKCSNLELRQEISEFLLELVGNT